MKSCKVDCQKRNSEIKTKTQGMCKVSCLWPYSTLNPVSKIPEILPPVAEK